MQEYSSRSDMIDEIGRTLSINDRAATDTTLRKLQSTTRNNANTNFGYRASLVDELKDAGGQMRCAMFKRAAGALGFVPRDGELVEVRGRLGVYEARGDLQLVVESMERAGQGALFEQFLRLKAKLEAQGLFDSARKRPLPAMPRGIGVVTSLGAAALRNCFQPTRQLKSG